MIMMTGIDSAAVESRQVRHPVAIMSPRPRTAATEIGRTPNAAAPTTSAMMLSARLAFCVCGRSVVPSSTSIVPLSFRRVIASRAP